MKVATINEFASIEFRGLKDFSSMSKDGWRRDTDGLFDQLRQGNPRDRSPVAG
jgi:hypothetical protein